MSLPKSITAMLAVTYETQQIIDVLYGGDTPDKQSLLKAVAGLVELDFPQSLASVQYFDDEGNLVEKPIVKIDLVESMDKFDKREELEAELRNDMFADQIADDEEKD